MPSVTIGQSRQSPNVVELLNSQIKWLVGKAEIYSELNAAQARWRALLRTSGYFWCWMMREKDVRAFFTPSHQAAAA
jgi:hypothetical protein